MIVTGTANVTNNSTNVTVASGFTLSPTSVFPGAIVSLNGATYGLASITNTTAFVLTRPYTGATASGIPLEINTISENETDIVTLNTRTADLLEEILDFDPNNNLESISNLTGTGVIYQGATGNHNLLSKGDLTAGIDVDARVQLLADRAAYDNRPADFAVYVNDIGDGRAAVYFKLSNANADWSTPAYQTGPSGLIGIWRGDWTPSTAYSLNDVVSNSGNSYIALVSHTSNSSFATDLAANRWAVVAAKGDTGTPGSTPITQPQGRLSLASGVPVTVADITGAATVYYVPMNGQNIPIRNSSAFIVRTVTTQLSLALDADNTHTGYHQSLKVFDLFAIYDGSILRLATGPAWATNTSRGTGAGTSELETVDGIIVNKNAITARFGSGAGNTISVPARQATYLGSFEPVGNGLALDTERSRLLFNAYNQVPRSLYRAETATSWIYSTGTWRIVNNNGLNVVEFLLGLDGVLVQATAKNAVNSSTATPRPVQSGIGLDNATPSTKSLTGYVAATNAGILTIEASFSEYVGLGYHNLQWLERGNGADVQTWFGNDAFLKTGISGAFLG